MAGAARVLGECSKKQVIERIGPDKRVLERS